MSAFWSNRPSAAEDMANIQYRIIELKAGQGLKVIVEGKKFIITPDLFKGNGIKILLDEPQCDLIIEPQTGNCISVRAEE